MNYILINKLSSKLEGSFLFFYRSFKKPLRRCVKLILCIERDAIEDLISDAKKQGLDCFFLRGLLNAGDSILESGKEIHFLGTSLGAGLRQPEFQRIKVAVFSFNKPENPHHREPCRDCSDATFAVLYQTSDDLCLLKPVKFEEGKVVFEETPHKRIFGIDFNRTIC